MNILLFVMSMLMILALMTYGRLESFLGFAFVQSQFKVYMEKTERNYVNEEALARYNSEKGSTQEKQESDSNEKNSASSTLSFSLFVDKNDRAKFQKDLETQMTIAKNLIYFLYGDQPFFIQMEEKRPDFVNEIFAALIQVTNGYTKEQELNSKKKEEIATVDLGDSELNDVFTKMLKGSVDEILPDSGSENQDVQEPLNLNNPYKPERGYYSLLNFITLQKNKLKIRVYLASPQLLMAIYGNSDIVRQIIEMRNRIYYDLINASKEGAGEVAKTSQEAFQRQFQNHQLPLIPQEILDFGVSKTNPRRYTSQ